MSTSVLPSASTGSLQPEPSRLDYLDATRAFALVLGVVFHASLSFVPIFMGWAVQDVSTSPLIGTFMTVSHSFRMETFFLLAGFFAHLTFHQKGARAFGRSRVLRIVIPFVVGWFILRPLVVSGWIMGAASLRGDYDFWGGIKMGLQSLATLPAGLFTGTHLWFLYYLALITALALLLRAAVQAAGSLHATMARGGDALMVWLARSGFRILVLVIPTAGAIWFMRFWAMDTPDQTLKPHLPVLIVYGGFFGFGWMLSRQRHLIPRFTSITLPRCILALIAAMAVVRLSAIQTDLSHPYHTGAHVGFVVSYAVTMWLLVFLTIGVFRKLCQRPRAWIRYVADSSYWMYLIHLPLVVWLQVAVAELPFHWTAKLVAISVVTVAIALLTYDLFVRSTWVGWLLNGQRRSRVLVPTRPVAGR